jgi:hypothetical protein
MSPHSSSKSNDAARDAGTGRPSGLGSQVIRLGVDDNRATDDRVRSLQAQVGIDDIQMGMARVVGHDVTQITQVTFC